MNKVDLSGRHSRWQVILSEFDYEIKFRPGAKNGNADALSRITGEVAGSDVDDEPEHFALQTRVLASDYMTDDWYKTIYLYLETLAVEGNRQEKRQLKKRACRFFVKDLVLYHRELDGEAKICVTKENTSKVLCEYHDGVTGGHFGREITIARVRRRYWWPSLWKDAAAYIKTCDHCQRYGPRGHNNSLHPYQPLVPFEFVFMDFIISLPRTPRGNKHIITMTEGFTKWCDAMPCKDATASNAAKFLSDCIVHRFGVPEVVVTDNGSHFRGEFHDLCLRLGIQHMFATPYHPQTAGQDERTNGLILNRVRKWRLRDYVHWDQDLPSSVLACNTRKVSTTGFSPMQSLLGYDVRTTVDLHLTRTTRGRTTERLRLVQEAIDKNTIDERLCLLESLRDEAIRVRDAQASKMANRYNQRVRPKEFSIGDLVLLYDSTLLKQWSRKLEERWLGPFRVLWRGSMGAYTISTEGEKTRIVSGDHLKKYHLRE